MISELEYSILSTSAYEGARSAPNVPPLPSGFQQLVFVNQFASSGFEGKIFLKGDEIVVAYAGTDQGSDWIDNVATFVLTSEQIYEAALLYFQAKTEALNRGIPAANITFTGHSLGGGLASVMALYFARPAVVFDAAPFLTTATNPLAVEAAWQWMQTAGLVDAQFNRYHDAARAVGQGALSPLLELVAEREVAVTGHSALGSFLSIPGTTAGRINDRGNVLIPFGHDQGSYAEGATNDAAVDLHMISLMTGNFLDERLSGESRRLWHLLYEVFNDELVVTSYSQGQAALLEHLNFAQFEWVQSGGTRGAPLLSAFLDDVALIESPYPFTLQAVVGGAFTQQNPAPRDDPRQIARALVQLAVAYYAQVPATPTDAASLHLFQSVGGDGIGLRLDKFAGFQGAQGAKLVGDYLVARVVAEGDPAAMLRLTRPAVMAQSAWVLPNGGATRATAGDLDTFLLGSQRADSLTGGAGKDILYGDIGADLLDGSGDTSKDLLFGGTGADRMVGAARDELYGGRGYDRYEVDDDTGTVVIEDQDGIGQVTYNGRRLKDGLLRSGTTDTYDARDGSWYKLTSRDGAPALEVFQGGLDHLPLTIRGYKNGDLGITLRDQPDPNDPDIDPKSLPAGRDPLVLDLDGDGIETIGPKDAGNNVYFDATGAGVPELTGWVLPDDGFLALDRNGNGRIDSGQELFGDSTPLAFGGSAIDGFDALAQEDTNRDGWVDALDDRFDQLRIWRDLNQNGVSDAGELQTLADTGIAAVRVTNVGNRAQLANGNRVADLGSFRWASGQEGTTGLTGDAADIDLGVDLSRQQLPPVAVDPALQSLPNLRGRGAVYSLHEAATLSTELADALRSYVGLDRAAQQNAVDALINTWARSSDMQPLRERGDGLGIDVVYARFERPGHFFYARPVDRPFQQWVEGGGLLGWQRQNFDAATWATYEDYFESRIFSLEAFSGDYFYVMPGEDWPTPSINNFRIDTSGEQPQFIVPWAANHLNLVLWQRYESLRQQVYESLAEQTRLAVVLAPLNDPGLADEAAFAQIDAALRSRIGADALAGIGDLIDVNAIVARRFGIEPRWHGHELLADTLAGLPRTPELQDLLLSSGVFDPAFGLPELGNVVRRMLVPGESGLASLGATEDDVFVGTGGNDYADGREGADQLMGRGGNDQLHGSAGDDVLDGGTGDDLLAGGSGQDSYRIGRDEGRDTLIDDQGSNTLVFKPGVAPSDVHYLRQGRDLLVQVGTGSAQVRVLNQFNDDGEVVGHLDGIAFDDGSVVTLAALGALAQAGTGLGETLTGTPEADTLDGAGGDDHLSGLADADTLRGGEGRDRLLGGEGDDQLEGGSEADLLFGEAGNDRLDGGTGADQLDGGAGDDTLAGGRGRDSLTGGAGVDRFGFALGDGDDVLTDAGASTYGEALRFGAGIAAGDLRAARQGDDLLLQIGASTDRITLRGWFAAGATPIDRFEFADGTVWNAARVRNLLGLPTAGADALGGTTGADLLDGADGNDVLAGGDGNDQLLGGAGGDVLVGGTGADILDGGADNDTLDAGTGNDTVRFGPGAGNDTLMGVDATAGKLDRVLMANAVRSADVLLYRAGNDLLVTLRGKPDTLRVVDHFAPPTQANRQGSTIDRIDFGDGSRWTLAQINAKALPWTGAALPPVPVIGALPVAVPAASTAALAAGAEDNRTLTNGVGGGVLEGGNGDDTLQGAAGPDVLRGGAGMDQLRGGDGDDVLAGGTSADTLMGGAGSDRYDFARGDGSDVVVNGDASASSDRIQLGAGIVAADVTVQRDGADLLIQVDGPASGDALRVQGFFGADAAARIDALVFADGSTWLADDLAQRAQSASAADDTVLLGEGDDVLDAGPGNDVVDGAGGHDTLRGGSGLDLLRGGDGDDWLDGGSEADQLQGGEGADTLLAGAGDDQLDGGAGDDLLDTGPGNDSASFGAGQDTLRVRFEDGNTTLDARDAGARETDRLVFEAGIVPAGVGVSRAGDDLVLRIDEVRSITVRNHYAGNGDTAATLERVEFEGVPGTVWTAAQLRAMSLAATPDHDRLLGFDDAEVIDGLAGNDLIEGRNGDDVLIGNTGNDQLDGGEGADTYRFGTGWGRDTLRNGDSVAGRDRVVFDSSVDPASLTLRRIGRSLLLSAGNDSLHLEGYFDNEGGTGATPATIEFEDAAHTTQLSWDLAAVRTLVLRGTPGDDAIQGHASGDTITAGAGNDRLNAAGGNDTYVFARGFGHDRIENLDDGAGRIDTIRFAGDIQPAELDAARAGNSLWLTVGSDTIEVANFFLDDEASVWRIDRIEFEAAPGATMDQAQIVALSAVPTEGDDGLTGTPGADTIAALGGHDQVYGRGGDDQLQGDAGVDRLFGGSGNDMLLGGPGDDDLYGDAGNDTLAGGPGGDYLDGGAGRDTVRFARGDGSDSLVRASGTDALDLSTLQRSEVRIQRDGDDLVLVVAAGGDSLRVSGHFASVRIDELRFADQTLDAAAIEAALRVATPGDDTLYGGPGADTFDGLAGNDLIAGLGGDDRLRGGPGTDLLVGGPGNDRFVFNPGDGADSIDAYDTAAGKADVVELGAGIAPADVRVTRVLFDATNDLLLSMPNGDSLRILGFGRGDGDGPTGVQQLRFADGTVWTTADLRARSLLGTAAAEVFTGYDTPDLIDGGAGDDTLRGGLGNDTYLVDRGDGHDTIDNADGTSGRIDTLRLGATLARADVALRRTPSNQTGEFGRRLADDLMLDLAGGGSVRVHHFFAGEGAGGWQIDRIEFANGDAPLDVAAILAAVRQGTPGDDLLIGTTGADTLNGLAGHDTLQAGAGDDTLEGGTGDDALDGGAGDDHYRFAAGWGSDTIAQNDASTTKVDRAVFVGLARAALQFSRDASDLFVARGSTGDRLRIAGFFLADDQNARQVDEFVFTDATLTAQQVRDLLFVPTEGADTLYGTANSETIDALGGNDLVHALGGNDGVQGGAGADELHGDDGDDTLDGGTGDDLLVGGAGNDTYRFGNGRGAERVDTSSGDEIGLDRVRIDDGITPGQLVLLRSGADMVLRAPDGSTMRLLNFLAGNQAGTVNRLEFGDGTVWSKTDMLDRSGGGSAGDDHLVGDSGPDDFDGRGGRDTIEGRGGNDVLDGGAADGVGDTLVGGPGDDTYRFGPGDGPDTISESTNEGSDRIVFRSGTTPASLRFNRVNGDDLRITTAAGDLLRVSSWFSQQARVERFEFADGTVWLENDVLQHLADVATAGDDVLTGTLDGDVINALGGRDTVWGRSGNDQINGGPGSDWQLQGEAGDDTIHGDDGDDYVVGGPGNDTLFGDAGGDTLQSDSGDDTLDGGAGNDQLRGFGFFPDSLSGSTTYRFGANWGQDTVQDTGTAGSTDTLAFYGGTLPSQLLLRHTYSASLGFTGTLNLTDGLNTVTVFNHDQGGAVERIQFLDAQGAVLESWDPARIAQEALRATAGADAIGGTQGADVLSGLGGDDTLVGLGGADRFDGGEGDDLLAGLGGADSYHFAGAFGNDRVRDVGPGSPALDELVFDDRASTAFSFNRSGDDLVITETAAPQNQVTVEKYFLFDGNWSAYTQRIERLRFTDATWDADTLITHLLPATEGDDTLTGTSGNDTILGLGGNDTIRGEDGNDTLDGGDGNDNIDGGLGADTLRGGAGDDRLNDGSYFPNRAASDDTLEGGPGTNQLFAGAGADTYVITPQTGYDIISNTPFAAGPLDDRLLFQGIDPASITVQRWGYFDLRVVVGEATGFVELGNYVVGGTDYYQIGRFEFSNGTVWSAAEVLARMQRVTRFADFVAGSSGAADDIDGGDGDDQIHGLGGADTLRGGAGDDRVYAYSDASTGYDALLLDGGDGDDLLQGGQSAVGGAGNDTLRFAIEQRGGTGSDVLQGVQQANTYRFARGDGVDRLYEIGSPDVDADRIVFDAGIARADLRMRADGGVLVLAYGAGDEIRLEQGTIETVELDDGTVLTLAELVAEIQTPTEGDDTLVGSGADDVFDGLGGNDLIFGGGGSDTLIGGAGNDQLDGGGDPFTEDTLDGGLGDDQLEGSGANTRIRFRPGDGADEVTDVELNGTGDTDTLDILLDAANAGTLPVFVRVGDDLSVRLGHSSAADRINFRNWFADATTGVEWVRVLDEFGNPVDEWDRSRIAAEAVTEFDPNAPTEGPDDFTLGDGDDTIDMRGGDDTVRGQGGNDTLTGGDGSDILEGGDGNDTLDGSGGGYDELYAGDGDDTLISGEGSGFFDGNNGADTYRIGTGAGSRFLIESGMPNQAGDVVALASGIDPGTVFFEVDGNAIVARRSDEPGWAVLMWGMLHPRYGLDGVGVDGPIETLRFDADGSTLSAADMRAALPAGLWLPGDAGDNTLAADGRRNTLWGHAGNDTLSAGAGDDWLYGGSGDDQLRGEAGRDWIEDTDGGADTYHWQRGDGTDWLIERGDDGATDRIVFGAGVAVADVTVTRQNDDLVLHVAGAADGGGLEVLGWFVADAHARIEEVQFADGTVWTADEVESQLPAGLVAAGPAVSWSPGVLADAVAADAWGADALMADALAAFVAGADDAQHQAPARVLVPADTRWRGMALTEP